MKNKSTLFLVQAALIAAVYVVLTLVFASFSYGEIQVRISEALTILPFFTPAAYSWSFCRLYPCQPAWRCNSSGYCIRKHRNPHRSCIYLQTS